MLLPNLCLALRRCCSVWQSIASEHDAWYGPREAIAVVNNYDNVLARANAAGRHSMTVTHEAMWSPSTAELSRAIENNELEVYYQPIVDLQSRRLAGVEALIRWQHPERGLLSAGSFIEQAEAAGFGLPLAEWVQRAACRQAHAWSVANLDLPIVSLNISPAQATPDGLGPYLGSLLDETGLDPQRLAVELHEASLAQTVFAELAPVGIPLWADDSFTGRSAISYLTHVPFSALKIYKGFLWSMMDDPQWARSVTELIGAAHHLGLPVIAVGVRSTAHIEFLREHGCDMIQGGYFSPPVPVEVITALLEAGGDVAPMTGDID
jgi:EAL domain-containing protein (putative c-di-GMP-specific phosphodiesterase class I)